MNTAIRETLFATKNTSSEDKLRGGYYTPLEICDFLAKWAVQSVNAKVLEPSCGDGHFIKALSKEFGNSIKITGIELFPEEAEKASLHGNKKTEIITSDAFSWFIKNKPDAVFDAVIGNPPFIRYQNFPEEHRTAAFQIMQEEGLSPTRLTNAWLPFVVLATRATKLGGRVAMVLPAELLQVTYALELRKYLSSKFRKLTIITFKKLVFPGILQETVLLLGERGESSTGSITFLEFNDLFELEKTFASTKERKHDILDINHDNEKWTQFYLSREELNLIRRIEGSDKFLRLNDIADVNVGVVTGNNKYFVLNSADAEKYAIVDHCIKIIGRSSHVPGINFTSKDYGNLLQSGGKLLLFNPDKLGREQKSPALQKYINLGEEMGVTMGYKCRIRLPHWWEVPSVWIPDAFLLRQIYEGPRIIANRTRATATDTVHRVRLKVKMSPETLAAVTHNSLTFALAEIRGRSYGGGVLELEPTEARSLLIPKFDLDIVMPIEEIDSLIRNKKTEAALNLVDSIVLRKVGLSTKDVQTLRDIWKKLRNRRTTRNKSQKQS